MNDTTPTSGLLHIYHRFLSMADSMDFFTEAEATRLKRTRDTVNKDLFNEMDYEDVKQTVLTVAKKRCLSSLSASSPMPPDATLTTAAPPAQLPV